MIWLLLMQLRPRIRPRILDFYLFSVALVLLREVLRTISDSVVDLIAADSGKGSCVSTVAMSRMNKNISP